MLSQQLLSKLDVLLLRLLGRSTRIGNFLPLVVLGLALLKKKVSLIFLSLFQLSKFLSCAWDEYPSTIYMYNFFLPLVSFFSFPWNHNSTDSEIRREGGGGERNVQQDQTCRASWPRRCSFPLLPWRMRRAMFIKYLVSASVFQTNTIELRDVRTLSCSSLLGPCLPAALSLSPMSRIFW